ncbi:GCN5 family acetyltransferase [Bifidobacterium goeldii]|uniref:GCN5 family acetyltransferase n=1 Tax=Bifidobacterium goeldii TaxID=2306975 RepID=A0A430FJN8_9BIFI|nr:GNAT family N-acetyltransferase [Bifidobacterium goeldii]RSX53046.1 GCN5 family acetyltransferase [Bifidobacterium goeldii]
MTITYTEERNFTKDQVQRLFRSVGWVSGEYPDKLYQALMGSSTVFSAWDGERLVGLVRALDDGAMLAYMHYVLVDPEYQGHGIAGHMVTMIQEKYRDFLYVEVMPEESKNAAFYQRFGFKIMADGVAMQTVNPNWKPQIGSAASSQH